MTTPTWGVWVTDARIGLRGAWCQWFSKDFTGSYVQAHAFADRARVRFPEATYEVRPYYVLQKPMR
jgi:hypothetical protein